MVVDVYAVALAEVVGGGKLGVDNETDVREADAEDAVEGEDAEIVGRGLAVGGRAAEMAEHIPAALEELDAIGLEVEVALLVAAVAAVDDGDTHAALHGRQDGDEHLIVDSGGLGHYAVLQREALGEDIAHGDDRQHPVLHRVAAQHFGVGDIVAGAVLHVAGYIEAENILYLVAVAAECGARHRLAAAHVGAHPEAVDLGQRDALVAVDGVDEPDVFLEFG